MVGPRLERKDSIAAQNLGLLSVLEASEPLNHKCTVRHEDIKDNSITSCTSNIQVKAFGADLYQSHISNLITVGLSDVYSYLQLKAELMTESTEM